MIKIDTLNERELMHRLNNKGHKNLYEWIEKISDYYGEEQAIEERTFINENKEKLMKLFVEYPIHA